MEELKYSNVDSRPEGLLEQVHARYDRLKQICKMTWDSNSMMKLDEAFRFASEAIGEKKFQTGEYILLHSLDVATIIAGEIGLEPNSVITGLLHNIMYTGLERKVVR